MLESSSLEIIPIDWEEEMLNHKEPLPWRWSLLTKGNKHYIYIVGNKRLLRMMLIKTSVFLYTFSRDVKKGENNHMKRKKRSKGLK